MLDFSFALPTHIHFGESHLDRVGTLMREQNAQRVLLVYGQASIKRLGLYDRLVKQLKAQAIEVYEVSGVKPNPSFESVLEGRQKILDHDIDFILAVGGGSVIDAAKAMSFSHFYEADELWQRCFIDREDLQGALPLGCVVTLSGTGTETNGNSVITNEATHEKWSVRSPLLRPVFGVIDPEIQQQAPHDYRLASAIDIMHHLFEQYFDTTEDTQVSDYLIVGLLKSVKTLIETILEGKETSGTRQNLAWASTLGLSFIFQQGKKGEWASHRLSYVLTERYGVIHGYALTMVYPALLKTLYEDVPEKLERRLNFLGQELFEGQQGHAVIERMQAMFRAFGAPTTYREAGINKVFNDADYLDLAGPGTAYGDVGTIVPINQAYASKIFKHIDER